MIFEEFDPNVHDSHKVAELIFSVDYRTYCEVFKSKENAISAIRNLLLAEKESDESDDLNSTDDSKSKLYVILDDSGITASNFDNTINNTINNNIGDNNGIKPVIGMLQTVEGKKDELFGDILYVLTKLKSADALRFSYIYFLDSLVLANTSDDDLYIAELAIDESQRGKGLGKKAIRSTIETARNKGFKRVVLDADLRNDGATRLYEEIGFRKFNQKCARFFKKERGMYNMEYIL